MDIRVPSNKYWECYFAILTLKCTQALANNLTYTFFINILNKAAYYTLFIMHEVSHYIIERNKISHQQT